MQFEYDPEHLIKVISKRPGIWDYDLKDYRDKRRRMKLWHEVVQELMAPDVEMSKGEFRELELQLQKKWKSLKDCFHKYVSNPHKTKRPYLYSKQLQFLLKNMKLPAPGQPKEEGDSEEEADEKKPRWKPRKKLKLSKHDDPSDEDDIFNEHDNDQGHDCNDCPTPRPESTNKGNPYTDESATNQFAFANVDTILKDNEDSDKMFLMSLLPHLKSIPEEFKLNAKMELMQVLQQANYSIGKLMQ